jgi:hypothetical protein
MAYDWLEATGTARDMAENGKSYSCVLLRCTVDMSSKNIKHVATAVGDAGYKGKRWFCTWNVQAIIQKVDRWFLDRGAYPYIVTPAEICGMPRRQRKMASREKSRVDWNMEHVGSSTWKQLLTKADSET